MCMLDKLYSAASYVAIKCILYFLYSCIIGGAMRLPNKPDDPNKTHYLTDYYAKTKFNLPLVPFNNSDDNAFVKFYNMEPLPIKGTFELLIIISLAKLFATPHLKKNRTSVA